MSADVLQVLAFSDNRDILATLRGVIQATFPGARLLIAPNKADGLELARAEDPDIALIDIAMRDVDAFALSRELKQDERLRIIPVIFVNALSSDMQGRIKAMEAGADGLLNRPLDAAMFAARIGTLVNAGAANKRQRLEAERLAALVAELETAQKEARLALQHYRRLFEASPVMTIITRNEDGRPIVAECNAALLDGLGYARAEVVGRPLANLYTSEARERLEAGGYQRALDGRFEPEERRLIARDGRIVETLSFGSPEFDAEGRTVGTLALFVDITEQKRAEQITHRNIHDLSAMLEMSRILSVSTDMETVLQSVVETATHLLGLDTGAIYLLSGDELSLMATTPPLPPEFPDALINALLAEHPHISESLSTRRPVLLPDAKTAVLTPAEQEVAEGRSLRSILYLPLQIGGRDVGVLVLGTVCRVRSFTEAEVDLASALASEAALAVENARLFRELEQRSAELERRVEERTAELVTARERAESADRVKSAFLASMSHELRTPLNSIIGFTGIMLLGLAGPLNDEQTRQMRMVQGSSRHLLALINDVLDISKIEAGQLEVSVEPFDVRQSIEKAISIVAPMAETKGLELTAHVAAEVTQVVSDRRRVEQVLYNLLSNAIKFTAAGAVRIECEVSQGWLVTRVRDTGQGIRSEDMGKLFKAFTQVDSGLARHSEGTGLGLSICKRLLELLGGEIWAQSEWGVGSIFTFTLPIRSGA